MKTFEYAEVQKLTRVFSITQECERTDDDSVMVRNSNSIARSVAQV